MNNNKKFSYQVIKQIFRFNGNDIKYFSKSSIIYKRHFSSLLESRPQILLIYLFTDEIKHF